MATKKRAKRTAKKSTTTRRRKKKVGFAAMSKAERTRIARKGGKAAHKKTVARRRRIGSKRSDPGEPERRDRSRWPRQARCRPYNVNFQPGDRLKIRSHHSAPGRGLSYGQMTVIATDEGRGGQHGGWDVYDGVLAGGKEVSFYGFSVVRKVPKSRKRAVGYRRSVR